MTAMTPPELDKRLLVPAEETFRFPLVTRLIFWLIAGLFLIMFGISTVSLLWPGPGEAKADVVSALVFVALATLSEVILWLSHQQVTITSTGITRRVPGLADQSLRWSEVRWLRENSTWSYLELHGLPGEPVVKACLLLKDFARLRRIIEDCCPQVGSDAMAGGQQPPLPVTFHKSWFGFALMYSGGLLMIFVGTCQWPDSFWDAFRNLACAGMGMFAVVYLGREWHSVTVEPDHLTLRALLRSRTIPLSEIAQVNLEMEEVKQAGITSAAHMALFIELNDGERYRLGQFRNQTMLACEVIRSAWRKQGT